MEEKKNKTPTAELVKKRFASAIDFKKRVGLYDTVHVNENFFIGKQWEGVVSNGLPTPTFNILKQVVNFTVSTITSDNMSLKASPMPGVGSVPAKQMEGICKIINNQYDAIIERNRVVSKMREVLRNAAVDGDGCMYFHFDPNIENGQLVKGDIVAEVVQNTRVHFGNPNCRDVQKQPWIIMSQRMQVEDVRYLAEGYKETDSCGISDIDSICADSEVFQNEYDSYTDDKVTVMKHFYKDRKTKTIWCMDVVEAGILRKPYDTRLTMYPFIWMCWDYIQDSYHGQAMITGLIPNQVFINKMFAMVGVSLMALAFPKVLYDKTKVASWDGSVGTAIGVNGPVDTVAKTIDGAGVNPQIAQFIELVMSKTKELLGATDVAMGNSRPDNTSAIIALQRAANTPNEMTKQAMYQALEEMGKIWLDFMPVYYGVRNVETEAFSKTEPNPLGIDVSDMKTMQPFDFSGLKNILVTIRQDAGASAYWSEIATMQTIENLMMNGKITLLQFLERIPSGYISEKEKLIEEVKNAMGMPIDNSGTGMSVETTSEEMPVTGRPGNGALQRAVTQEGAAA